MGRRKKKGGTEGSGLLGDNAVLSDQYSGPADDVAATLGAQSSTSQQPANNGSFGGGTGTHTEQQGGADDGDIMVAVDLGEPSGSQQQQQQPSPATNGHYPLPAPPPLPATVPSPRANGKDGRGGGGGPPADRNGSSSTEAPAPLPPSSGLTTAEAEVLLQQWGRNELQERSTPKWLVFLQQLWGPMPVMLWVAIVVELIIENWLDFGILLTIQLVNATISWYESIRAADAVAALKASLKPIATAKRDGKWQPIDASLLVPGDLVLLASGAAVPADCRLNGGVVDVDQSALTGESLPVTVRGGGPVKMGSTITRGEVEATVEQTGVNTFFGKTATLIQSVRSVGNLQKVLLKVMVILLVLSFVLSGVAFIYLLARGEPFKEALEFTIVLIVASIPIAIEIVCTATLAIGSRQLSKFGAIVTRLVAIEEVAGMNMLCSDKTGTLTLNTMVIQEDCPVYSEGEDRSSVLRAAALAAKWREPPKDALDTMVLGAADLEALDNYELLDHLPFDPTVKRTESTVRSPAGGPAFKVSKGAPHIMLDLLGQGGHATAVRPLVEQKVEELGMRGIRSLAVARTDASGHWRLLGILTFLDPPRPDTKDTIERAQANGVDVKMITGDHLVIARETARMLGMGTNICPPDGLPMFDHSQKLPKDLGEKYGAMVQQSDGFAQVYPEHKFMIIEALRQSGFAVGMTGDGVNDAPALKRADVGIAVSGSTDAARAAADIVLTEPGLGVIIEAIVIARCIFQRVYNFFNYRIAATMQLLFFFFISVFAFKPSNYAANVLDTTAWPSYFQLPVFMLMLITLLNDGTLISIAYDRVLPSSRPEKWNLKVLFLTSIILGVIACGSSLLLLWGALDSNNPGGWFQSWGLPGLQYGQVITMVYLKVSVSDFLTLFSSRTRGMFFAIRPSWMLMGAAYFSLALSTLLACVWPEGTTGGIPTMGLSRGEGRAWWLWVWLYCIFWWLVQDSLKALTYWLVYRYNVFGASRSVYVPMREADEPVEQDHTLAREEAGQAQAQLLHMKSEDGVGATLELVAAQGSSATTSADVTQPLRPPGTLPPGHGLPNTAQGVASVRAAPGDAPLVMPHDQTEVARGLAVSHGVAAAAAHHMEEVALEVRPEEEEHQRHGGHSDDDDAVQDGGGLLSSRRLRQQGPSA